MDIVCSCLSLFKDSMLTTLLLLPLVKDNAHFLELWLKDSVHHLL
jgi:hypothetical protein